MHKFTLFTIGLSVIVILVVAEVVVNDYLGEDFAEKDQAIQAEVVEEELMVEAAGETEEQGPSVVDSEVRGDEGDSPELSSPLAEATAEPAGPEAPQGTLTPELLASIGVLEPKVETVAFNGLVFGLFDVQEEFSGFTVLEESLFDGSNFIGVIYEIATENELQTFGAYETLRQKAQGSSLGTVNENNNYGEASFYFNHATKTSTVFLVVQKTGHVYAMQYSPSYHGSVMKPLLEKL